MNITSDANNFCEKRLIGNPEYFSSFSALFISLFPIIGIIYNKIISKEALNIFSILIITGFTSFGYHWYGWYLFKLLDEIPMILAVWLGIYELKYDISKNIYSSIIVNLYFILIITINSFPQYQYLFPILFTLSMILLIPLLIFKLSRVDNNDVVIKKNLYNILYNGVKYCLVSGIIWILSERYCNILFILAHSIWHFGIGLGVYHIIIFQEYYCNYINKKNKLEIEYKFSIIPIIK